MVNDFRKAGIHPFSIEVVPDSVFDVSSLKQWQEAKQTKANQMYEQMIEEAVSQPPIIIELSSVEDQFIITEENSIILPGTSADVQSPPQSSTSSDQLVESCNVSFENILLETITSNFTEIVKKKKRVAKGAEVITSEETKLLLFLVKNIKEKTPNSSSKEDDNLCSICK